MWGLGFGVWGLGFELRGGGFGVCGLGVGVRGWRFGVLDLGYVGVGFGVFGLVLWGWAKPVDRREVSRVQDSSLGAGGLPGVEEKVPPSHRSHEGEAMASWKDPGRQGVQREAPAGVREECV